MGPGIPIPIMKDYSNEGAIMETGFSQNGNPKNGIGVHMVSVGVSTRTMRRGAFLLAGAAIVLLTPLLLSAAYASGVFYPYVNTASILTMIVTVDVVVILMAGIAVAGLSARRFHNSLLSRRTPDYRIALPALIIILILPAFMVAFYGEWGSPFWYVVYIGFLPAGAFIAGQVVLLAGSIGKRLGSLSPLTLTVPALLGSLAAPGALVSYVPFGGDHPLAPVLVGLLALTAACDIALGFWVRMTRDLAEAGSPDVVT